MAKRIQFRYYPKNSLPSPQGDGDILKKCAWLAGAEGTMFHEVRPGVICAEALKEWIIEAKKNPAVRLDTFPDAVSTNTPNHHPIASKVETVSFTYDEVAFEMDMSKEVQNLIEAPGSAYRLIRERSRLYVVGINAWLDMKIVELRPYPQSPPS